MFVFFFFAKHLFGTHLTVGSQNHNTKINAPLHRSPHVWNIWKVGNRQNIATRPPLHLFETSKMNLVLGCGNRKVWKEWKMSISLWCLMQFCMKVARREDYRLWWCGNYAQMSVGVIYWTNWVWLWRNMSNEHNFGYFEIFFLKIKKYLLEVCFYSFSI